MSKNKVDSASKDAGKIAGGFLSGLGIGKWLWAGAGIILIIGTVSVRHYINKEFKARQDRIEALEEERDNAIRERNNAEIEKSAAEGKYETEKERRKQAAEDAATSQAEKEQLKKTVVEGEKRIDKLRKEIEDGKFSAPEPDPISGNDVANADALSDRYNCYILYANSGEVAECN